MLIFDDFIVFYSVFLDVLRWAFYTIKIGAPMPGTNHARDPPMFIKMHGKKQLPPLAASTWAGGAVEGLVGGWLGVCWGLAGVLARVLLVFCGGLAGVWLGVGLGC